MRRHLTRLPLLLAWIAAILCFVSGNEEAYLRCLALIAALALSSIAESLSDQANHSNE